MKKILRSLCGPIIFLFLLFCSCSPKQSPWKINRVEAPNPMYNSSRFVFSEKNARFEIYKTTNETVGYFSVTSLPIPELPNDPAKCLVKMIIDEEQEDVICHRVAGGQKVLLPEIALYKVLQAMESGRDVVIKTGRYSLKVDPLPKNELKTIL